MPAYTNIDQCYEQILDNLRQTLESNTAIVAGLERGLKGEPEGWRHRDREGDNTQEMLDRHTKYIEQNQRDIAIIEAKIKRRSET